MQRRAVEWDRLVATRRCDINGLKHSIRIGADDWPLVALQHDEREPPARKVLLMSDIFVSRHHQIEPILLRGIDQIPIRESIPAHL